MMESSANTWSVPNHYTLASHLIRQAIVQADATKLGSLVRWAQRVLLFVGLLGAGMLSGRGWDRETFARVAFLVIGGGMLAWEMYESMGGEMGSAVLRDG